MAGPIFSAARLWLDRRRYGRCPAALPRRPAGKFAHLRARRYAGEDKGSRLAAVRAGRNCTAIACLARMFIHRPRARKCALMPLIDEASASL